MVFIRLSSAGNLFKNTASCVAVVAVRNGDGYTTSPQVPTFPNILQRSGLKPVRKYRELVEPSCSRSKPETGVQ